MELVNVIGLLKKRLEDLRKDASIRDFDGGGFRAWAQGVEAILIRGIGDQSTRLLAQFRKATLGLPMPDSIIDPGAQKGMFKRHFENKLPEVEAVLGNVIWELEMFGLPDSLLEAEIGKEAPKVFVAHGGESIARAKLCEFLDALEVVPVIADKEPSENRSVNEHIDWCLDQSDCVIVLATKGDIDGRTGNWIPRGNILIEIGKVQERFPRKAVYLLEEGATFPTNVSEKVWERFTHECTDRAFIKVAKELVAFGIIRAVKP